MAQRRRPAGRQSARSAVAMRATKPEAVDFAAVRAVVEPAVIGSGYELDSFSVKPVGRRHLIRIVIDGDGALGLDVIADVSRVISRALDDAEETGRQLIPGEYQLEVSSPGVDRPLTTPAHWRRNIGRTVKVRTSSSGGADKTGERSYTGRVAAADDQGITLEMGGVAHRLGYRDLGPGRVQIEFHRLEEIPEEELEEFDDDEEER